MAKFETGLLWVIFVISTLYVNACMAMDCQLNNSAKDKFAYTINVDQSGKAKFKKVQQAIDSIPSGNTKWIRIFVAFGTYAEKVTIPRDKGCIFIEGEKKGSKAMPTIAYESYGTPDKSAIFTAFPDNIVLKNMAFENTHGLSKQISGPMMATVAARLLGDRYAVIDCMFIGLQDTLWDGSGRHYYKKCYISGAVDFIWGSAQSIYERCQINVTLGPLKDKPPYGVITAQGREKQSDTNGFVFKDCFVTGDKTMLGRAYRAYSRVIFYQSWLSDSIVSSGWDAWGYVGQESKITYVEEQNKGPGANKAGRVRWLKQMSADEIHKFVDVSYINQDGWMSKLPPKTLY